MFTAKIAAFFGSKLVQVILVLTLVAGIVYEAKSYHDSVYASGVEAGISTENKVWTDRETLRVDGENKRIDGLEKTAKALADAHAASIKLRDERIAELDKKLAVEKARLNTVVYKKDGTANLSCPADTQIFLGTAFSDLWNQYNAGALQ